MDTGKKGTQGEHHVTTEAGTRVMHLEAKGARIVGNHQKLQEAREESSLQPLEFDFRHPASEQQENNHLLF